MMELSYSPKARTDLRRIKEFIIEKFDNEQLAKEILLEITRTVRNLTVFPYMGEEVSKLTGVATKYRCLYCRHNYIFYRVETEKVYIVRILDDRQDYMRVLFGIVEVEEE